MRVKDTARLNLKLSAMNPGAIRITKNLAKIMPTIVNKKRNTTKRYPNSPKYHYPKECFAGFV